jgi:capsular polysaccharide biosynthesis protein
MKYCITETFLTSAHWRYGHLGRAPSTTVLRMRPDGTIAGYDHPNERRWAIEGGVLSFFAATGERTVRFDLVTGQPNSLVLQGAYLRDPHAGITLCLEQTTRAEAEAIKSAKTPGAVLATFPSPAFDISPPDLVQPDLMPPDVRQAMERIWNGGHFGAQDVRLTELRDVYVAKEGLVFSKDLELVEASVTQHSERDWEWSRAAIRAAIADGSMPRIEGTCVLCKKRGAANYGHWLMEMLPKALYAHLHLTRPRCIVARQKGQLRSVMHEGLRRFGYAADRVVELGDDPAFVERLILVDGLTRHGGYMSPLAVSAIDLLGFDITPGPDRKLYVTREPAGHRRFTDPAAVAARAEAAGYRVFNPGLATLHEQIAAFAGAQVIVGVMGAALTNIVFAPPGAQVVNLAPASMPDTFFWFIVGLRSLRYREVRCALEGPVRGNAPYDRDMVFPDELAAAIFP